MTISIIIVNYNAGLLLTDCVRSALASTVPVEVLISDNGSVDNSLDTLRQAITDPRVHIIENKANLGFSCGNNRALRQATGEYVLFLNPDCIIQPSTLSNLLPVIENQPDIGMVGCLIKNPDGTEQRGCRRNLPTPWTAVSKKFNLNQNPLPDHPIDVEAISGAFMLIRRSALDAVGSWDEGYFLHCEDLDLCMRFHLAGQRIVFVPTVEVTHAQGTCSQNRRLFVEWHKHKGMARFYNKFYREKYPLLLMGMVLTGIWLRFLLIAFRTH